MMLPDYQLSHRSDVTVISYIKMNNRQTKGDKMKNKRFYVILGSTLFTLLLAACGKSIPQYDGTEVQGVSDTKILIGNTAATKGLMLKLVSHSIRALTLS